MDIEFHDNSISEKAIFYKDCGHSFDSLIFYGHEFTLIIFDIMVFSFVDLFAQDFLLAAIVTFFVGKVSDPNRYWTILSNDFNLLQALQLIRNIGGKSNLARKTLIDKRFLI